MATAEGKSISSLCWVTPTNITFAKANRILKPNEAKDSHMAKSNIKRVGKFTSSMEEKRKGLYLTVVKSATRKNLVSLSDFFHNSYIS